MYTAPMQRRSLLGLILASPLGWLIPNGAKAALLPGSQYKHFGEVLDDVAEFAGRDPESSILCYDNPEDRTVGWSGFYYKDGFEYSKTWAIKLSELKRLVSAMPDKAKSQLIQRALMTSEGKLALAKSIEQRGKALYAERNRAMSRRGLLGVS